MQQTYLCFSLTHEREFLAQIERVVPRADLVDLVSPYAPQSKTGHPQFDVLTMPHIHFTQQWFTLSDPAM
jgi:IS5 family transposase